MPELPFRSSLPPYVVSQESGVRCFSGPFTEVEGNMNVRNLHFGNPKFAAGSAAEPWAK